MDSLLKSLIAAACLVVIAGGGYFAWGQYKASERTAVANEAEVKQAREYLAKKSEEARLSQEECIRMAKETLPEKNGQPVRTMKYNADLKACDDLKRFDATWRQALGMAGVF